MHCKNIFCVSSKLCRLLKRWHFNTYSAKSQAQNSLGKILLRFFSFLALISISLWYLLAILAHLQMLVIEASTNLLLLLSRIFVGSSRSGALLTGLFRNPRVFATFQLKKLRDISLLKFSYRQVSSIWHAAEQLVNLKFYISSEDLL